MALTMTEVPGNLAQQLRRAERRKRAFAISLALPLLIFLLAVFLIPIGALLVRAVENPEVARVLGQTVQVLDTWDRKSAPPDTAYAAIAQDLTAIEETAFAGALARRLNSEVSGARSLIMSTYRAMPLESGLTPAQVREQLLAMDERWAELGYWQAIAKNGSRWTPDYLLASVDLRRDVEGHIVKVDEDSAAYSKILLRTFEMSAIVTLCALLLGYPLAYWLSTLSARKANMFMILVLVPFWTSVLVRSASWIVLLQNNGLVNRALMGLGVIDAPLPLLFNRLGVIIAMVHILLPFMILPLYSVMKSVPRHLFARCCVFGQFAIGCFFPCLCAANLPRHRCRWSAGVHFEHWLLRDAGLAGRRRRPNAELLHCPLHQRQRQLGHGLCVGRRAAVCHAGAVCPVPQGR